MVVVEKHPSPWTLKKNGVRGFVSMFEVFDGKRKRVNKMLVIESK